MESKISKLSINVSKTYLTNTNTRLEKSNLNSQENYPKNGYVSVRRRASVVVQQIACQDRTSAYRSRDKVMGKECHKTDTNTEGS